MRRLSPPLVRAEHKQGGHRSAGRTTGLKRNKEVQYRRHGTWNATESSTVSGQLAVVREFTTGSTEAFQRGDISFSETIESRIVAFTGSTWSGDPVRFDQLV